MSLTSPATNAWLYFLSGALVPTLAFLFLRKAESHQVHNEDDDEDEDMIGVKATGPSSSWNILHAPYKVSLFYKQYTSDNFIG